DHEPVDRVAVAVLILAQGHGSGAPLVQRNGINFKRSRKPVDQVAIAGFILAHLTRRQPPLARRCRGDRAVIRKPRPRRRGPPFPLTVTHTDTLPTRRRRRPCPRVVETLDWATM